MKLNGKQQSQFNEALCSAFTRETLARMVRFELDERLDVITSGETLPDITFSLISWAEQYGRMADLVAAAPKHNPNNPDLKKFVSQLAGADEAATVAASDGIPSRKPEPNARLADAQAAIVQKFYADLRTTEKHLNDLYYVHMPIGYDPPEVDIVDVIRKTRELTLSAEKHSIYFSAEMSQKLLTVCNELAAATRSLEHRERLIELDMRGSDEEWEAEQIAFGILNDSIPPLMDELEHAFREILGLG